MARKGALLGSCLVALTVVSGCTGGGGSTLPATTVQQRYEAAVQPANNALNDMVNRALAYANGSRVSLTARVTPTGNALKKAMSDLNSISASAPLRRDLQNVSTAMGQVVVDLNTLNHAASTETQAEIARLVADAGAVAAAENVVELALDELTTGTTPPPLPVPSTLPTTTTSSVEPHTSTTRSTHRTTTTLTHRTTTSTT